MVKIIIGINGPIGSGKNEVANILAKEYGFKAVGFADLLKESAAALFNIEPSLWNELKNKDDARITLEWSDDLEDTKWHRSITISAREFLKRYGTEAHRDVFWDTIWVDLLLDHVIIPGENYAIYDARFNNELRAIKQRGGFTIQVRRPLHEFDPSHPSETPPDPVLIDAVINNNGNLKDLEFYVKGLVEAEKLAIPLPLAVRDNPYPSPLQQPALSS